MGEITNPHDRFFRERLAVPEIAEDFLRHYLPGAVAGRLDLGTIELEKDTFVDSELREHRSDLVYRVRQEDGEEAFVYVLLEHKSAPDPDVAFQLLRYVTRLWEKLAPRREGLPLPPVIPLVVYHGTRRWRVPDDFAALVRAPAAFKPYVVDFRYHLIDLTRYSDREIRGAALLRVVLLSLRHVFDRDLAERVPGILALLREVVRSATGFQALEAVLRYLGGASDRVGPETFDRAMLAAFPDEGEAIMSTLHGKWMMKGSVETAQKAVISALRVRFGEVPTAVIVGVESTEDLARLEELLRRAITAASIDEFAASVSRDRGRS